MKKPLTKRRRKSLGKTSKAIRTRSGTKRAKSNGTTTDRVQSTTKSEVVDKLQEYLSMRPCPFCSSRNVGVAYAFDDSIFLICTKCGAKGPWALSESVAIKAWNEGAK